MNERTYYVLERGVEWFYVEDDPDEPHGFGPFETREEAFAHIGGGAHERIVVVPVSEVRDTLPRRLESAVAGASLCRFRGFGRSRAALERFLGG